jgi:peptide-methionine (S)-S-oxide reductase
MDHKKINFSVRHGGCTQSYLNFSKQVLLKGTIILLLGFALLILQACENSKSMKERESIAMAKTHSTPEATKPLIDASAPLETEMATFAMGWFWGPDSRFGSIPGVIRTRVGYAGGIKKDPTYHHLGDHTEAVQIDYDPKQISYEKLLDTFWDSHNSAEPSWSKQYMSIIFFHNERQKKVALATRDREAAKRKQKIFTEIIPATEFYLAEAYHQKYRLRQEGILMKEFSAVYPNTNDFINSTAAARVNGYLDGYGTLDALQVEIDTYGLSPRGKERLLDIAKRQGLRPGCKLWTLSIVNLRYFISLNPTR